MRKKILLTSLFALLFIPTVASAITYPWDRTSSGLFPSNKILDIIFGNTFQATSTSQASVFPFASTTVISGTTFCLTGDLPCRTTWPTGSVFPFTPQSWGNSTTSVLGMAGFIVTGSSTLSNLGTGSLYVQNGLLQSVATTSASQASQAVWRDASQNAYAQNFVSAATTFPSLGTTATLTVASPGTWVITGTNTQTFKLPVGTTLTAGALYNFNNNSTQQVTVIDNGNNVLGYVPSGGSSFFQIYDVSTTNGSWDTHARLGHNNVSGTNTLGVGTTSPFAQLSVHANNGSTNRILFAIGSSTQTATSSLFSISNIGSTTLASTFGACSGSNALTTNSSGTIVCGAISGTGGSGTVNSGLNGQVAYYAADGTAVSGTSTLFFDAAANNRLELNFYNATDGLNTANGATGDLNPGFVSASAASGGGFNFIGGSVYFSTTTIPDLSSGVEGGRFNFESGAIETNGVSEISAGGSSFTMFGTSFSNNLPNLGLGGGDIELYTGDVYATSSTSFIDGFSSGYIGIYTGSLADDNTSSSGGYFSIDASTFRYDINSWQASDIFLTPGYGNSGNVNGGNLLLAGGIGSGTGSNGLIAFGTNQDSQVSTTGGVFDPHTVRFGIGTTSPYAKLSIAARSTDTNSQYLFAVSSSTAAFATSTLFSINNIGSTTLYKIPSSLLKTDASGTIVRAVPGTDYQTFGWPFTPTTNFGVNTSATSTPIWAQGGIFASTTSVIGGGGLGDGLTINGNGTTTNNLIVNGCLSVSSLSSDNQCNGKLFFRTTANTNSTGMIMIDSASNASARWWLDSNFTQHLDNGFNATGMIVFNGYNSGVGAGTGSGKVAVGSTTPYAQFSVQKNYGSNTFTLFSVASSTASNSGTANTHFTVRVPSATTTIDVGQLSDTNSKACFNTKNTAGSNISFYFVGTTMVVENNACK